MLSRRARVCFNETMNRPLLSLLLALLPLSLPIRATAQNATVAPGREGWLFLAAEQRHLQAGPFWGEHAAKTAQATAPGTQDPEAAIVDLASSLKAQGVELVFVPVPPKAVVMADKLATPGKPGDGGQHQQAFYARLREQGVTVVDLTASFIAARTNDSVKVYCRQDAHWSPAGIQIAAVEIAAAAKKSLAAAASPAPDAYTVESADITITGDLWTLAGSSGEKESIRIETVKKAGVVPTSDETSPVLLLGDSHTLFLSAGGDMQAVGAGLPEHLARTLGMQVEVMGVKGSGAGPSRLAFARKAMSKPGWLAGKKVVVYCLASRELTEATGVAWKKIPVKPK